MLEIQNFSKSFDDNPVIKNVSLSVKPGEFLVVLGPSGSGKTTLLRMINGLVKPDFGRLIFKNEDITGEKKKSEARKHFGMIFQHYNLVENLNVINNVLTGALSSLNTFYSLVYFFPKSMKVRALKYLNRVQLLDKAYEKAGNLSGGQKQRAGIARAIMQNPSVILADEPIANLDPMVGYNIMRLLRGICVKDKISVICNLHQVDFALQFADRIVCIVEGEIILDKPVDELSAEVIYQAYKGKDLGMFKGSQ
ncbi:MAG: phosphonate ABC transporter ATP-binding protein [Proteobacteria bacterium]|nr:phosphonate ABC transporter ATP-binding protein [Pseudomonadota bacterium]